MLRVYALFGVLFTGLNNVAVYQNKQISGKGNQVKSFGGLRPSSIFRSIFFYIHVSFFIFVKLVKSENGKFSVVSHLVPFLVRILPVLDMGWM